MLLCSVQIDSAAFFEQLIQAFAYGAKLFKSQQSLGSAIGILNASCLVNCQEALQWRTQQSWVMLQRQDPAIAQRGKKAIFGRHRRVTQLFQYSTSLTVTDPRDVQHANHFTMQAPDGHTHAKEMLEVTEVMLVADQYHRNTFGQGAAGCCGANVGFLNATSNLQRQQWPVERACLARVDDDPPRIDAENCP